MDIPLISLLILLVPISLLALKRYFKGARCTIHKNLTGKIIAITGANTGIGRQTALSLARCGATVLILCRDLNRARGVEIQLKVLNKESCCIELDLSRKKSIEECANQIMRKVDRLDILINNAGLINLQRKLTEDSNQNIMATNHLGSFRLTSLLWPLLLKSQHSRVIFVSSLAHRFGMSFNQIFTKLDFQDFQSCKQFVPFKVYSRSKLANVMFCRELSERSKASKANVSTYSCHPGVVSTQITRQFQGSRFRKLLSRIIRAILVRTVFKTSWQGAQTSIYLCLQDKQKLVSGGYYSDCRPAKVNSLVEESLQRRQLWSKSQQLMGKFQL